MQDLIVSSSRYWFAGIIAFYCWFSFMGASMHREKARAKIYILQNVLMFLLHLSGFLVIYIIQDDIRYVILYFIQFVFLFVIVMVYDVLYPKASRLLINNMCTLMSIGFIIIARLDFDRCLKQTVLAAIGAIFTFFVPWMLKRFRNFRNFGYLYAAVGFASLVAVLFSNKVFGANLNITIGPVSIQPSEFVKIIYIMFVASMFNYSTKFTQSFITTVIAAAHIIVLVLSNDLGSALIFAVVYLMLLYIATQNAGYLVLGTGVGAAASVAAYKLFAHVRTRITIWRDPFKTVTTSGYQICQSLFAIGAGGWIGTGLYKGMPEKVPVAVKDMIFSAITEEFGVIFAVGLLLICLNNLILMMNIASRCNTLFYRLVACGIGVTYAFQVFLTVGGCMNMIPLTGVTLPFVSYGGSSVISSLFMFGMINGMYNMREEEPSK